MLLTVRQSGKYIVFVTLLLSVSHAWAGESPNYCNDPATNSEWANILKSNPSDDVVARLFALRIGICELVKRKIITLERATDMFELERVKALKERELEQLKENNKSPAS